MLYVYITVVVVALVYLLGRRQRTTKLLKRFSGPPSLPLIGNLYMFTNAKENLTKVAKMTSKYGNNLLIYLFTKPYIIASDPEFVEFILGSNKLIHKSQEYKFFVEWFGLGLLTSTGQKWRSHRKILTPSFHYTILEEFVKVFDKQSFILVSKLKKDVGKDSIDIFKPISLCTLDIICETAMGTQVNAQENPDTPFVSGVREMCSIMFTRCFSILRCDLFYYFSKTYQAEKRVVKIMRGFNEDIIRKRKQFLLENTEEEGEDDKDSTGLKKKFTFLDVLLKSKIDGMPISDTDIREQVDTFMFEGHDTTSIAISFILYCLSKNLDIQARVYDELKSIYGDDKEMATTYDKLQEMKYMEQVIKEGLRLYPPVSIFARTVHEDVVYDGTILPKGVSVALLPYIMHRDAKIYPDPEKFDPERFTLENQAKRHTYAYIPFSAGPRNCIGQKFAMLELKCTLAKVLRHFEVLPAIPDHVVEPMIKVTLESANGIKMRLSHRK